METYRPLLTTYAYNILGSLEDARDTVQDAYLAYMQADTSQVQDPKAYLVRTVINLSINQRNKLLKQRAEYLGEWLPEPVATERADAPVLKQDILSYSLMVLLEKLNTLQRAVFILKEAFDYEHSEIAEALDITPENSRKLLSRARQQLAEGGKTQEGGKTYEAIKMHDATNDVDYVQQFSNIIRSGDTKRLEKLLHHDIAVWADGGGKVKASINTIYGVTDALLLLNGLFNKFYDGLDNKFVYINHQPAFIHYKGDEIYSCQIFTVADGKILSVFNVRNPDKLKSLII
jgi:RNA polymerase sigma factor (sigma-70 family)